MSHHNRITHLQEEGTWKFHTHHKESVRHNEKDKVGKKQIAPPETPNVCELKAFDDDPRVEGLVHALIDHIADKWTMIVLEVPVEKESCALRG